MKKWKCCLTAIVIAAGSMLVGCQESSSAKPIEAMYIPAGEDGHLMVGEGTGNVFTVTMPDNIQDKNGKKISEEDLNRGDIVAIYGDGIMLESYPGQYPGVTKIKVVKEGKASDADQYQDILDEFWPEKDPGELPYLNMRYWEVLIGKWHKPWNRELESELTRKEKRAIKGLAWAEQPQTINEVGSTFTIQGFDLNYAGVILGPSVKYRNGKVIFDPSESCNEKAIRNRTLSDGTKQKFGEILIQHEVRVLMTRGVNGMYIYACDPELQKALLEAAK